MIDKISDQLREKIKTHLVIDDSMRWKINDDYVGILKFEPLEKDLYLECVNWYKTIKTDFPTSKNYLKINKIGRFSGVRPLAYYKYSNTVQFQVEEYEQESWKDWFEEVENEYEIKGIEK